MAQVFTIFRRVSATARFRVSKLMFFHDPPMKFTVGYRVSEQIPLQDRLMQFTPELRHFTFFAFVGLPGFLGMLALMGHHCFSSLLDFASGIPSPKHVAVSYALCFSHCAVKKFKKDINNHKDVRNSCTNDIATHLQGIDPSMLWHKQ